MNPGKGKKMLPYSNTCCPGDKSKGMLPNYVDENEVNALLALSYIGNAISEHAGEPIWALSLIYAVGTRESVDEAS